MSEYQNELGQPIGFPVEGWQACSWPPRTSMEGKSCRVEAYDPDKHNADLYEAFAKDKSGANWTYMPYGPFSDYKRFDTWARETCQGDDPLFHSVIDLNTGKAAGVASYLRITPAAGVIEVGHIHFSPLLQRTTVSTEAMFLMMQRVFDELGYRRYEWKCDALNAPSCKTAQRLGFSYEGIFRQALMYKNRNRDTAWFAIVDKDWPSIKAGYQKWLDSSNFDNNGSQKQSLTHFLPDLVNVKP